MVATNYCTVFQFLFCLWTTSLIALQKTNAQQADASSSPSIDSSYFYFQHSEFQRDCKEVFDRCSSNNSSGVYNIKPDGYSGPFEVFCDYAEDSSGWTVIQRRKSGGTVDFNRDLKSYKSGFGYLSHEFWFGNERLSYLTNQKSYQLLIEFTLSNGSAVSVSYNNFRIGDEFSGYKLVRMSQYSGNTDSISWCPSNMVYDNCTCGQRLCRDPTTCLTTCTDGRSEGCICPGGFYMEEGECVPESDCGCYISEEQTVVPEGDTHINIGCTRIANCSSGQLTTRSETYECSPNAVCEERTGTRRCYCNGGFTGDGETCESSIPPTDCMDIYNATAGSSSGVYIIIKPRDWPGSPFNVYCNMTDGGGWTVFQRRIDGDVDFYQDWNTYKQGFGDVGDEHWLGNEQLYYLTKQGNYQLKIDLVNSNGAPYYAKFSSFSINNEADNYRLAEVSGYSGTADSRSSPDGYALTYHRGYQFSTKDRDNDVHSYHCARDYNHGAWWYNHCYNSNLNGDYHGSGYHRLYWYYLPGDHYNIKFTEMKIRPV